MAKKKAKKKVVKKQAAKTKMVNGKRVPISSSPTPSTNRSLPIGKETREQAIARMTGEVNALQKRVGNIKTAQSQGYTGNDEDGAAEFMKNIDAVIEDAVKSGKVLNPDLTEDDLKDLDPAEFMRQAENAIAPEYKAKFDSIKENMIRQLSNIGYDLSLKKTNIAQQADETILSGTEDLAGRGLAFSSNRGKFEQDVATEKSKAIEEARTLAFRDAQSTASDAEQKIGTDALRGVNAPQIDNQSPFQFSSTPLVGSLTSERQYLQESMARELETQERERRAYATRNLSFA